MISRAHMRRQLRANGGITNLRQGYILGGITKRLRKLIPNELADVAVKAAPFVAMLPGYGPAAAGLMRGIGRFDQRGDLGDALKQGIGTFAGGKLFGKGMEKFAGRPSGGSALETLSNLKDTAIEKTGNLFSGDKKLFNKIGVPKIGELAKQQLLFGATTGGLTYIYEKFIKEEPPQQPGETMGEYMARRKKNVSTKMKQYMDNYMAFDKDYTSKTEEEKQEYIDSLNTEYEGYNQGGRVGYQTGGISMTNTAAQNRAINNARRAANQQQLQKGRDVQRATSILDSAKGSPDGYTDLYNKYFYGKGNLGSLAFNTGTTLTNQGGTTGLGKVSYDTKNRSQIIKDIAYQLGQQGSQANAFKTADDAFIKANPNYYVRDRGGVTGIPRGPNGGYIIDGVEYFSEQEAIDAMGMDRYTQVMSKGGRVGLAEGTNELMKRIEELMDEGLDYNSARAQAEREMSSKNMGGLMRLNYMIGGEAKQLEAGAPPIMYSGNMDPNQRTGLPSIPGPIQMAEDGPEFDMRENGGFQPLGRQEGKDDVPAMLAKNEFVMTADAVRAAGGGSIQKGAQKMYDTMKKLESRVS